MKFEGTIIINMDYDDLEDLKHNMRITLNNHECNPELVNKCINRVIQDLKLSGITINEVMD